MNPIRHNIIRVVILGLVVLALLAFTAFQTGNAHLGKAAGSSPGGVEAVSPAQEAAIQGAQLLLIQQVNLTFYLPLLRR
jgi:hypothetical protein